MSISLPNLKTDPETAPDIFDKNLSGLPHRVLIVDDNVNAAWTLSMLVEEHGHNCKTAHDGSSALKIASSFKPKYIFLDLSMPGEDGYELCARLKALPELANSVFIAQTGWSDKEFMDRAKQAGFSHYLVKPIGSQELDAILV